MIYSVTLKSRVYQLGTRSSTNGSSMPQHSTACRSARVWELLVGVLEQPAACRSKPKLSHDGLFFSYHVKLVDSLLNRYTPELDGSSVVYDPDPSLRGPGFHSRKWQIFSFQFFSTIAQISAFLVLFCHVKSRGYSNYRGITRVAGVSEIHNEQGDNQEYSSFFAVGHGGRY